MDEDDYEHGHRASTSSQDRDRPPKKKRIHLNCKECRRTKTRCDRNWPCSGCVAKGLADSCPNGVLNTNRAKKETIVVLEARIKTLEAQLRRHGIDPEPEPDHEDGGGNADTDKGGRQGASASASARHPAPNAFDMVVQLNDLVIQQDEDNSRSRARKSRFLEATSLYYPSPDISSDEGDAEYGREAGENGLQEDGDSGNARRHVRSGVDVWEEAEQWIPWGRLSKHTRSAAIPRRLRDRCRSLLPPRQLCIELFETFWRETHWRFQPVSRKWFFRYILPNVYESDDVHAHDLALLFTIIAWAIVADPATKTAKNRALDGRAFSYHETSYACLCAGKYFSECTPAAIATLHLMSCFLINSNAETGPEGFGAIMRLAICLAIKQGYHHEASIQTAVANRPDAPFQADLRRRVWHEVLALDRVHSNAWLLPLAVRECNHDTLLPSDAEIDMHNLKWTNDRLMARMVDYWTTAPTPPYSVWLAIDRDMRAFDATHMRWTGNEGPDNRAMWNLEELFLHGWLSLHRPLFSHSMISGVPNQASIDVILEICRRVIKNVDSLIRLDIDHGNWASFPAFLHACLHCLTALIIKTTDPALITERLELLARGVRVLEVAVDRHNNAKTRGMLKAAQRHAHAARQAAQRNRAAARSSSPVSGIAQAAQNGGASAADAAATGELAGPLIASAAIRVPTSTWASVADHSSRSSQSLSAGAGAELATPDPSPIPVSRLSHMLGMPGGPAVPSAQTVKWWEDFALATTGQDSTTLQVNHPSPVLVSQISFTPQSGAGVLRPGQATVPAGLGPDPEPLSAMDMPQNVNFEAWLELLTRELTNEGQGQ